MQIAKFSLVRLARFWIIVRHFMDNPASPKRKAPPRQHPPRGGSALWAHLDTIRAMRRARRTWAEIALVLERDHGIKTSLGTVRNFFKRASANVPLGFEMPANGADKSVHPVAMSVLDEAVEAARDKRQPVFRVTTPKPNQLL
jgi:hypothetical protein